MQTVKEATILLAENDTNDVILMQHAFSTARLANPLRVVRDGEEALQYLSGVGPFADRERFPLPIMLLLDLHMPKVDGFDVLKWLQERSEFDSMLVVVLTSSTDQHDFERAKALGADSYFTKPGSLEELVNLMMRVHGHWLFWDGSRANIAA